MQLEDVIIDVPWGKLAALVGGNPKGKPILCVHGLLDSANSLVPLINRLPDGFRYILIDLPGCGKSDPFPGGNALHMLQFLMPLKICIDHFGITKLTYIGHSFGAMLGIYFHLCYSDLIERIVCLDAINVMTIEPEMFVKYFKYYYDDFYNPKKYPIFNEITPPPTYTYEQVLELLMKSRGLNREAAQIVAERNLIPAGDNLYRLKWQQRMKRITNIPLSADYQCQLIKNMKIPQLMILSFDFTLNRLNEVSSKLLDVLVESNPDFELALVDGNHNMHLNDPEAIAKYVEPFVCGKKQQREKTLQSKEKFLTILGKL